MKRSIYVRFSICVVLVMSLLSPAAVLAGGNGKKHFSDGMKHEYAEEWDRAAEEFALAVTEDPKNPEYRLHLTRALFNASQMFMKKGTLAAKENDFTGAYTFFRRSYAFDPTNELAKSEMDRMVRLQQDSVDPKANDKKDEPGKVKLVQTSYTGQPGASNVQVPQRLEKMRDIPFPSGVDLQFIIKELAKDLDLNVLFDVTTFRTGGRKTNIDLKNVTAARALDYIFLQEGLFFQKVGPRTILVASSEQRARFQQLVLRTFFLSNASPKDIVKVVTTAIPAQPGRSQTIVLTDDATNSVTIRDTQENIRLIGQLIKSLDKDRAEVVMDVAIYEVNKSDLLQFGNQIGTQEQLTNFGASQVGSVRFGNNPIVKTAAAVAATAIVPSSIITGIILPSMNIQAFQSKNNTKLLASTQIHAFNNEDSSAVIGQRVPVQSASFVGLGSTGNTNGGNGVVSNVINYEQVGLTLKFKPIVFPNQDVQVAMEIDSKDVSGAATLTPTFTQRTIKGTARIQNNKTLLLASVAQDTESKGKQGLPLLGLIPIIGRLFTAPTRDNRQVDIVIAVTPRVIRAPAILPEDEAERSTGSQMAPTNNSLEAMIEQDELDERLAAARRVPNAAEVQLPDRQAEAPAYVNTGNDSTAGTPATTVADTTVAKTPDVTGSSLKPIDNSVKTLQLNQTSDTSSGIDLASQLKPVSDTTTSDPPAADTAAPASAPTAEIRFGPELTEMKAGEKVRLPVMIQGSAAFRSAVLGLKFDEKRIAVRSVSLGDVFGVNSLNKEAPPFINTGGKMFVTLLSKDGVTAIPAGILAYIEIEALVDGKPAITFDRDVLNFLTPEGKNFVVGFQK